VTSPLVSIIIPTFNREKELERALNSILTQTYSKWEVCIIDNNSVDNSINLIKRYDDPRFKIYLIQNNGIIGASRNLGIQNAKGKYLAFLDSDDWWTSTKLEKSVMYLEKEKADLVYHDFFLVNKNNQKCFVKKTKCRKLVKPIFNDLITNGNSLITSGVVVRSEIMTKISGFSNELSLAAIEDYDAWLKIALLEKKFFKISEVLGFYWLGENKTSNPKKTIQTLNALEEKFQEKIAEFKLQKKIYWIGYSRARAYYIINMKNQALKEFHSTLAMKPIFFIKCKVLFMIAILKIKKIFSS
jgi:glycosyltransferase involved in cell wall biosynthesis